MKDSFLLQVAGYQGLPIRMPADMQTVINLNLAAGTW
jgi:hypothetical protein